MKYEHLRAVLDRLSEGVVIFDRQGRILSVNRAARRLLGDPDQGPGVTATLIRHFSGVPSSALPGDGPADRDASGRLTAGAVEESLSIAGWNIAQAARRLGVSRSALYKRIRSLDLHRPRQPR